jgi:hypothetical protein
VKLAAVVIAKNDRCYVRVMTKRSDSKMGYRGFSRDNCGQWKCGGDGGREGTSINLRPT